MSRIAWRILLLALGVSAVACRQRGCLEVAEEAPLLEKPYPLDYPSTNPMPNGRVASLAIGTHRYANRIEGKDFLAYEIKQADGATGWLILDQRIHECRP